MYSDKPVDILFQKEYLDILGDTMNLREFRPRSI